MALATDAAVDKAVPAVVDIENVEKITLDQLLPRIQELSDQKMRFITATSLDQGDHFDIYYHFDQDLEMLHLLLSVDKEQEVPSISGIYLAAFLIENEMKELFGIKITDIAIDYQGHLYLTNDSEPTPMAKDPASANE